MQEPNIIEAKRATLVGVLASERLRRTQRAKKVLEYLGECYFTNSTASIFDVGLNCFPDHHVPDALGNTVRVTVRNLRKYLGDYFRDEGRDGTYVINIPGGPPYAISYEENPHRRRSEDLYSKFWAPYLGKRSRNLVLITAPRFWRDSKLSYIRNIFCNSQDDDWKMEYLVGGSVVAQLEPSFHYLSAGEAMGAMRLLRSFCLHQTDLEFDTDLLYQGIRQLDDCNLILIGCTRTSPLLCQLQQGEPFTLTENGVQVIGKDGDRCYNDLIQSFAPDLPEERHAKISALAYDRWEKTKEEDEMTNWRWAVKEYKRQKFAEAPLVEKYALLTRKPSPHPPRSITTIAANHGRAAQGVVDFLTDQAKLEFLFDWMRLKTTDPLPSRFQILFGVTVSKLNGEVAPETVVPIEWQPYDQSLLKLAGAVSAPSDTVIENA